MAAERNPLVELIAEYTDDPLGFVMDCFPWGKGILDKEPGPDEWQRQFLVDLGIVVAARRFDGKNPVDPILMSVASGHGIGKSTLFAWLHWWIMCTRPGAKGRVTANTYTQLETTTWAEIQKWHKLLCCKDWFEVTGSKCRAVSEPESWFSVPITCAEENSEAFAGQHNKNSTSFFLMDESSLIPDKIKEVAMAGLTDGEPMFFAAGNPTRNTGWFYEACFGTEAHRWNTRSIDARKCKFPNHRLHTEWIEDHGLESDYVRVRILGLPPKQAEMQLIGRTLVDEAQRRQVATLPNDPLIAGVDVPDGGSAWFVLRFRRGLDARPGILVPEPIRAAGSRIDREMMVTILAEALSDNRPTHRITQMFVDSAFGAPIVERLKALGYRNVVEISFGGKSPDREFANMRAYMWAKQMRDWLGKGAIDKEDKKLAADLIGPGFHHKLGGDGALVVESKDSMRDRGIASPDDADALALTFAQPVAVHRSEPRGQYISQAPRGHSAWMS
jgi:hypothetical protein